MKKLFLFTLLLLTTIFVFGQELESEVSPEWLKELGIYAKVFGFVLTGLGTILGLPLAVINFRKTRAEIRKLELEAKALESNSSSTSNNEGVNRIEIKDSDHVNIQVLADPRFLGPLLLLLDFIIAWILITLSSYLLGLVFSSFIKTVCVLVIAGILLIPIYQESVRVRKLLRPEEREE